MRNIGRIFILAALAATAASMLAGSSVASAESTVLCKKDATGSACTEPTSSVHLTSVGKAKLLASPEVQCNVLFESTSVGEEASPQIVEGHYTYTNCGCTVSEVAGTTAVVEIQKTGHETAAVTGESEVNVTCWGISCTYNGEGLVATAKGPLLSTEANGVINLSEQELLGKGTFCPNAGKLDIKLTPLAATYIAGAPTSLCSKDEGSPFCKAENQLKTIDYKDKALELLTNLINVKCEGLASGSVGEPSNPIEIKPELTFSNCGEGCFVTVVSGPGKVLLQREGKAEEAKAIAEGFEIFVKCGTTIKCLLGPEKMTGTALGPLVTGDNGHLAFSKVSLGKGEGATCPTEATLDATYVASSGAYIG